MHGELLISPPCRAPAGTPANEACS
jgi:hypothetical protein